MLLPSSDEPTSANRPSFTASYPVANIPPTPTSTSGGCRINRKTNPHQTCTSALTNLHHRLPSSVHTRRCMRRQIGLFADSILSASESLRPPSFLGLQTSIPGQQMHTSSTPLSPNPKRSLYKPARWSPLCREEATHSTTAGMGIETSTEWKRGRRPAMASEPTFHEHTLPSNT